MLDEAAAADPRIKVSYRAENGGIVAASNDCLDLATGEFVGVPRPRRRAGAPTPSSGCPRSSTASRHRLRLLRRGQDRRGRQPDRPVLQARLVARAVPLPDVHVPLRRDAPHLVEEVGGFRRRATTARRTSTSCSGSPSRPGGSHHIPEVLYHWRIMAGLGRRRRRTPSPTRGSPGSGPSSRIATAPASRPTSSTTRCDHPGWYHLRPRLREQPEGQHRHPDRRHRCARSTARRVVLVDHCVRSILEYVDLRELRDRRRARRPMPTTALTDAIVALDRRAHPRGALRPHVQLRRQDQRRRRLRPGRPPAAAERRHRGRDPGLHRVDAHVLAGRGDRRRRRPPALRRRAAPARRHRQHQPRTQPRLLRVPQRLRRLLRARRGCRPTTSRSPPPA